MAAPDYLQQVIVSGRTRATEQRKTYATRFGAFRRPSVPSVVWASLDLLTVSVAAILALRLHEVLPEEIPARYVLPQLFIRITADVVLLRGLVCGVPDLLYAIVRVVWTDTKSQRTE